MEAKATLTTEELLLASSEELAKAMESLDEGYGDESDTDIEGDLEGMDEEEDDDDMDDDMDDEPMMAKAVQDDDTIDATDILLSISKRLDAIEATQGTLAKAMAAQMSGTSQLAKAMATVGKMPAKPKSLKVPTTQTEAKKADQTYDMVIAKAIGGMEAGTFTNSGNFAAFDAVAQEDLTQAIIMYPEYAQFVEGVK